MCGTHLGILDRMCAEDTQLDNVPHEIAPVSAWRLEDLQEVDEVQQGAAYLW